MKHLILKFLPFLALATRTTPSPDPETVEPSRSTQAALPFIQRQRHRGGKGSNSGRVARHCRSMCWMWTNNRHSGYWNASNARNHWGERAKLGWLKRYEHNIRPVT